MRTELMTVYLGANCGTLRVAVVENLGGGAEGSSVPNAETAIGASSSQRRSALVAGAWTAREPASSDLRHPPAVRGTRSFKGRLPPVEVPVAFHRSRGTMKESGWLTQSGFFVQSALVRIQKGFFVSSANFCPSTVTCGVEPNGIHNELAIEAERTIVDDHVRPSRLKANILANPESRRVDLI